MSFSLTVTLQQKYFHSIALFHISIILSIQSATKAGTFRHVKPCVSHWKVMFLDVRFATVYRRIFLMLSNQMSRDIPSALE